MKQNTKRSRPLSKGYVYEPKPHGAGIVDRAMCATLLRIAIGYRFGQSIASTRNLGIAKWIAEGLAASGSPERFGHCWFRSNGELLLNQHGVHPTAHAVRRLWSELIAKTASMTSVYTYQSGRFLTFRCLSKRLRSIDIGTINEDRPREGLLRLRENCERAIGVSTHTDEQLVVEDLRALVDAIDVVYLKLQE